MCCWFSFVGNEEVHCLSYAAGSYFPLPLSLNQLALPMMGKFNSVWVSCGLLWVTEILKLWSKHSGWWDHLHFLFIQLVLLPNLTRFHQDSYFNDRGSKWTNGRQIPLCGPRMKVDQCPFELKTPKLVDVTVSLRWCCFKCWCWNSGKFNVKWLQWNEWICVNEWNVTKWNVLNKWIKCKMQTKKPFDWLRSSISAWIQT